MTSSILDKILRIPTSALPKAVSHGVPPPPPKKFSRGSMYTISKNKEEKIEIYLHMFTNLSICLFEYGTKYGTSKIGFA